MTDRDRGTRLTDPRYCIAEAQRLAMPVTEENWDLVRGDADALNVLQAAITHLVYADTEREQFQQQVLEIVFTAYLMGRTADERRTAEIPESFRALIDELDLSGLER